MDSVSNLKIAVLINTPPDETDFQSVVRECFREAFVSGRIRKLALHDRVVKVDLPCGGN
jgi:hypothetical protein